MTQSEKNTLILKLKCALSTKASDLDLSLSINKCTEELVEDMFIASSLIDVICRYNPCCTTTMAFEITLTKATPLDGNLQVVLTIEDLNEDSLTLATYIGTGTANEILANLSSQINTESLSTSFVSTYEDGVLTLWTCSEDYSPNTIPELIETDIAIGYEVLTAEVTLIDNFLTESIYNCIPVDEICTIANKTKTIIACECQ